MKKVLFASTALVVTAGVASAEVALSGSAEMGVTGGSGTTITQFHQDIEVNFTLSGATDNGLTFGASIQLDEAGWTNHADDGGTAVFLSGNFGTLTMGDTDGGFDWGMAEVPTGSGSINDDESGHAGWNGNGGLDGAHDGQVLRYDHSVGGLGFAVSIELDDNNSPIGDDVIGLGLRYEVAGVNIGLGYQTGRDVGFPDTDVMGISLGTTVGGINVGVNYSVTSRTGVANDETHFGIGASYSMDAITIGVNYGQYDDVGGNPAADRAGFGLSAGYDLGGGASILLGYGNTTDHENAALEQSTWSLGLSMSF